MIGDGKEDNNNNHNNKNCCNCVPTTTKNQELAAAQLPSGFGRRYGAKKTSTIIKNFDK